MHSQYIYFIRQSYQNLLQINCCIIYNHQQKMSKLAKNKRANKRKRFQKIILSGICLPVLDSSHIDAPNSNFSGQRQSQLYEESFQLSNDEGILKEAGKLMLFLDNISNYTIMDVKDSMDKGDFQLTQKKNQKPNSRMVDMQLRVQCDDHERQEIIDKLQKLSDKKKNMKGQKNNIQNQENNPYFYIHRLQNIQQFITEKQPSSELNLNSSNHSKIENILDLSKPQKPSNKEFLIQQIQEYAPIKFAGSANNEQQQAQQIEIQKYVKYILIFLCVTAFLCVGLAMIPLLISQNSKQIILTNQNSQFSLKQQQNQLQRKQSQTNINTVSTNVQNSNPIEIKQQIASTDNQVSQPINNIPSKSDKPSQKSTDHKETKQLK